MTNSTIKSEQPLIGKGLLYSEKEATELLHEGNQLKKVDLIDGQIRKSWEYSEVFDQGNTSMNVGCVWTTYVASISPGESLGMTDAEFARSLYHEAQVSGPWDGTEAESKYGASVLTVGRLLKEKKFFNELAWTKDVNILSNHVLAQGPAIVASRWTSEMSKVDPNGFVRPNGSYEGNHCWIVYGVDDQWETFFALNSWGRDFGKDGKFLVKFSDMEKILQDGFAIATF